MILTTTEQDGTTPASLPNPFVINATDISFGSFIGLGLNPQNDDAMRVRFDLTTLSTATKIVVETIRVDVLGNLQDASEIMLTTTCETLPVTLSHFDSTRSGNKGSTKKCGRFQ